MEVVTITLPEESLRWARAEAARNEVTVAEFVERLLVDSQQQEETYKVAMEGLFERPAKSLRRVSEPLPARDSLYDR